MEKIQGIILRTVKYGDNAHIVDLFTDIRGRMSVIMKRGSSRQTGKARHGNLTPSYLLPLNLVEFNCEIHGQNRLPQPKDFVITHPYQTFQSNPIKVTIGLFLAEFLCNVLQEEGANPYLFNYIRDSLKWMDYSSHAYANFHLVFTLRMTRFLGIFPNTDIPSERESVNMPNVTKRRYPPYYDLLNSEFCHTQPNHRYYLQQPETDAICWLLRMGYNNMHLYHLSKNQRQRCLNVIIEYYRLHLTGFREIKSLEVLHDVFE